MSQELLTFLEKLHVQSGELLEGVQFDQRPQRDGYIVCLYASMIELCGGIALLVGKGRMTSVSPVFRTFLEAYVDFKSAFEDATYIKVCFARHHQSWIKVLRNAEQPNPFLAGIRGHAEYDATLKRHEADLQKLKKEGVKPLKPAERFRKADMAAEHLSIYHFESDKIHNGWTALIDRHFEGTDDGFRLALYKERQLDEYTVYLESSATLLLDATKKIHQRFESGHEATVEALRQELEKFRERLIESIKVPHPA